MLEFFVPPGLDLSFALILVAASFITSAVSASAGLGGGIAMLAVMAIKMPVAALIPVHGVVQLGSNFGRAAVQRKDVVWPLVGFFIAGSVVGITIGSHFIRALPEHWLKLGLALFILAMIFAPKPKIARSGRIGLAVCGVIASALTMFFGATGVFVAAAILPLGLPKQSHVGTFSACMTVQHGLKIFAFAAMGFSFFPWLPMIGAMVASGFLGTLAGSRILDKIPQDHFRIIFKAVMLLLVARLLWDILPAVMAEVSGFLGSSGL